MFEEGQFKSPFECGSKFADIQLIFITLLHVIRDDTVCTFKVEITGGAMLYQSLWYQSRLCPQLSLNETSHKTHDISLTPKVL